MREHLRAYRPPDVEVDGMTERTCSIPDCDGALLARTFCGKHYQRWAKYGDPNQVQVIHDDDERRFWSKVDKSGTCWTWTGHRDKDGYGVMQYRGSARRASRLAWFFTHGAIPPRDLHVCHTCDNPPCVNPAHLWLGTNDENMADCTTKGRRPSGDRNGTRTKPETVRRGEAHRWTKLTWEQVQSIRAERAAGVPSSQLARAYGVSHGYINVLIRGAERETA
jgi:hypothetical protein